MGVSLKNAMISGIAGIIFCVAISMLLIEVKATLNYRNSLQEAKRRISEIVIGDSPGGAVHVESSDLLASDFVYTKAEVVGAVLNEHREYPYYIDGAAILPDEYASLKLEDLICDMAEKYTCRHSYDAKGCITAVYFYGI